jgi:hypothetical protein
MVDDKITTGDFPKDILLSSLTEEQKKLLYQALELVKQEVFSDVVKRLRNYFIIVVTVISLFGVVSVVGLKTAIKDATVGALREDAELRQSIKEDATVKVTKADEMLKEIKSVLEKAKAENEATAKSMLLDIEKLSEEARQSRREENLLFENSARELNLLVHEFRKIKNEKGSNNE